MEVIDTMVFVHAFNEDPEYHKEALGIIKSVEMCLLVPQNLLEFYNVFSKLKGKDIAMRNLGRLIRISRELSNQDMLDILLAVKISKETCIKIFDALLIGSAIRRKLNLVSFDKKLRRIYERLKRKFQF